MRLLRTYARPHLGVLFMGFLCLMILSGASVAPAKLMEDVVNEIFVARNGHMLFPVTAMIVGAFLLKGFAHYGASVTMEYVGQRMIADIQCDLFNHLIREDLAFFHNTPSGELLSRFHNDVNKLKNAVTSTLSSVGKDTLTLIFFVGLMFYQDWLLALIALFIVPVAVLPVVRIGKRIRRASINIQEHTAELTVLLSQIFQGMRIIKAYCMEKYEQTRIHHMIETIFKRSLKAVRIRAVTHPLMEFLGGIAIGAVVLYGGSQVIYGYQTPGAFFSFIAALMLAYEPLKRLANLNANLQEQLGAAGRVFALLDHHPFIREQPQAQSLVQVKGLINFKEVSFTYPHSHIPVLKRVSLTIYPGQRVAIVGASGSGKSTLMNLIPRFYDVTEGAVEIDGQNIRHCTLQSLRQNIALVSQEVMLFDDSIRANIAYGRTDASADEIEAAARAAAAHEFIQELSDGYETLVGEHGVKLSGGQRQRIAIARALLKRAPIVLLDEPTSALDSESEQKIQTALKTLIHGRTTIIIAHRLATVKDADVIFVIEKGEIIASGAHLQLLETCPQYRQLAKSQLYRDDGVSYETVA
jgi:subfamily B ATP-binding cassette protein MsbA